MAIKIPPNIFCQLDKITTTGAWETHSEACKLVELVTKLYPFMQS